MKYIKYFESYRSISDNFYNHLGDILLPLVDRGYKIKNIKSNLYEPSDRWMIFDIDPATGINKPRSPFNTSITLANNKNILLYEISDDLLFIIKYLESEFSATNVRIIEYSLSNVDVTKYIFTGEEPGIKFVMNNLEIIFLIED